MEELGTLHAGVRRRRRVFWENAAEFLKIRRRTTLKSKLLDHGYKRTYQGGFLGIREPPFDLLSCKLLNGMEV